MKHLHFQNALNVLAGFTCLMALAGTTVPARAVPIPEGTGASDDVVLNFDLTGFNSTYSFSSITLQYSFNSPDATGGDQGGGGPPTTVPVTVDIFGGLDGGVLLTTLTVNILGSGASPGQSELSLAGLSDGIFSVGLRVAPGAEADGSVFAFGEYTIPREAGSMTGSIRVTTGSIAGVLATTTPPGVVPEPATLGLMGLGLIGLAAARRGKG